ncbi:membrane protein insertion efficiency factor YidD [Massilia sp. Dwa41.01b]|uniref:membrane protein insertion efficiency factor YidD n=1 Tax=unclassified Massilia TaxID=2609279 RepID=UPI0016023AC7|nr:MULTISPECIES: membrane protein insertion efficiency factor YidD [unclassified Massilia]QNA88055.1 membrane protein insertion efficiency factor YidD [Massilia sp. Dwa41.01b]QNA98961.1 membrane protein insertion efficiency factor YidD [Massilia sp. Se16.2.3]
MATQPGLLASLALSAIRGYQRFLSPHKGFSCAYRCATGQASCSAHGYRVIERFGVWWGVALLRRRLRLCGETHRRRPVVPNPVLHHQRGVCDLPCDGACLPDLSCDLQDLSCRNADWACDVCQCADCGNCRGCDDPKQAWRDWRERRRLRRQRSERRLFR